MRAEPPPLSWELGLKTDVTDPATHSSVCRAAEPPNIIWRGKGQEEEARDQKQTDRPTKIPHSHYHYLETRSTAQYIRAMSL